MVPKIFQIGSNEYLIAYRTATDHVNNDAKIVQLTYTASTDTFGSPSDILDTPSIDDRAVSGGKIGGTIYVFLYRRDDGGSPEYQDTGYIESSDNGASWSNYTTITPDASMTEYAVPYGKLIAANGVHYQPYYGYDGATTYKVKLLKSTDSGATWLDGPTIYSGSTNRNEAAVVYLGNNKLLALVRQETGDRHLQQFQSTDNGDTWSYIGITNIGGSGAISMAWTELLSDGETIAAFYTDRNDAKMKIATGRFSSLQWNIQELFSGLAGAGGYPAAVEIAADEYLVSYYDEQSATDADIGVFRVQIT